MVELRWCGDVRVYLRKKPIDGIVAIEAAVFAGRAKRARCVLVQSFHGLKPIAGGYESAARAAVVAVMKSTPAGADLTGIEWSGPPEGFEIVERTITSELREMVWPDLEQLGKKGWDVA